MAAAQHRLASALWRAGQKKEAEPLVRQVLETRRRVLGEDHPDTLRSKNNLAVLLEQTGRREEAKRLRRHPAVKTWW